MLLCKRILSQGSTHYSIISDLESYKQRKYAYASYPVVCSDERVDDSIWRLWRKGDDGSMAFIESIELCDVEEWVYGFLLQNQLVREFDRANEKIYDIGEDFSLNVLEDVFFVEITKDILPLHEKIKAARESFLDLTKYIIEQIQKRNGTCTSNKST